MAENTVVKEQLSDEMIDAGAQLVSNLDSLGLRVVAALWLFSSETNEWRLLIASPEVNVKGPREVYQKIQAARGGPGEKAGTVPMSAISVVDADNELIQLFRLTLKTGRALTRTRFTKNVISGHFIEDALLYRVE